VGKVAQFSGSGKVKTITPMIKGGGVQSTSAKKAGVSSNSGAAFSHLPSSYPNAGGVGKAGKGTAAKNGSGPKWPHMPKDACAKGMKD